MDDLARDAHIRAAVFAFLTEQISRLGEVLPWSVLTSGFVLDGGPVPILGAAGIRPRRGVHGADGSCERGSGRRMTTSPARAAAGRARRGGFLS